MEENFDIQKIEQVIERAGAEAFHAEPMKFLKRVGIDEEKWIEAYVGGGRAYFRVTTAWWGLTIYLNHQACLDVEKGNIDKLTQAMAAAGSIGKVLGTALSLAFKVSAARVKAVDRGDGVHLPIPWPVLPTLAGVGTIVAWIVVSLKPNP